MIQKGTWQGCLEYAALTDIGLRRESNQDSFGISLSPDMDTWRRQGHVFLVADGMGAHAAGELASKLAAEGIPTLFFKYIGLGPVEAMRQAFHETNSEVFRRGQANPDFHNMGTTATTVAVVPEGIVLGHVGDSRVYRLRGKEFVQQTRDHSVVWELRGRADLPKDEGFLATIPRNWITRSIGPSEVLDPDISGPWPMEVGDTYLLCTDGLTGRVADEEIAAVVGNYPPQVAVRMLIDLANLRGGQDNTTVVVMRLLQPLPEEPLDRPPVPPAAVSRDAARFPSTVWITASVLFLAGVILGILQLLVAAAVVFVGVAVLAMWGAWSYWKQRKKRQVVVSPELPGPFARVDAPDARRAAALLLDACRAVRTEARQLGWEEDRPSLDEMENAVELALKENRYRDALDAVGRLVHELAERQRVFFKRYY
jgi:serine/threonine protein phosphatase PrpC